MPLRTASGRVLPLGATDWLRSLGQDDEPEAPPAAAPAPTPASGSGRAETPPPAPEPTEAKSELPNWLQDFSLDDLERDIAAAGPADSSPATPAQSAGSIFDMDAPEWLRSDDRPTSPDSPARSGTGELNAKEVEGVIPAWLRTDDEPSTTPPTPKADDVPAWLAAPEATAPTPPPAPPLADLPNWLDAAADQTPTAPDSTTGDQPPAVELPAWLREDAAGPAVPPAAPAEVPAWLQAGPENKAEPAEDDVPAWLRGTPENKAESAAPAEDLPAWLRDSAPPAAPAEAAKTESAAPAEDLPAWLRDSAPPAAPAEPEAIPAWLQEPGAPTPPAAEPMLPGWLRDQAETTTTPPAAVPGTPAADESVPAWLRESPAAPPPAQTASDAETAVPDWLRNVETTAPASPAQPERPVSGDLPPWLMEPAATETPPPPVAGRPGSPTLPPADTGIALPPWLKDEGPTAPASSAGASLPAWLQDADVPLPPPVPPPAGQPAAARADAESDFLGETELPGWLRLPEPERPVEPTVSRELDWLSRLGAQEDEAESTAPVAAAPAGPVVLARPSATRTPEQLEAVALLRGLAAQPVPSARPLAAPAAPPRRIGLHQIFYLLLLVAAIAGLFLPTLTGPLQSTAPASPAASALLTQVNSLAEANTIMLAYEWDAQRRGELAPLEQTLTRHLIERRARMILLSTDPFGTLLSFDLIEPLRAAGYNVDATNNQTIGGRDYVLLGYRPGGELALRGLAQDLRGALRSDFAGRDATRGLLATNFDGSARISSINDLAMIVVMADEAQDVQNWMQQIHSRAPQVPMVFLLPAEVQPVVQPYLRGANVYALSGRQGAYDYSLLRGESNSGLLSVQSSGQLGLLTAAFVALALIGAVVGLFTRPRQKR
jgi:hypothetical protein